MELWDAYDRDFNRVEVLVTDCAKDAVTLQAGETIAWHRMGREALLGMKDDELPGKRIKRYVEELRE